jgi:hypothetical protein
MKVYQNIWKVTNYSELIQNSTARTSVTAYDFEKLNWLNVENRVKQLRLNHMYVTGWQKCAALLGLEPRTLGIRYRRFTDWDIRPLTHLLPYITVLNRDMYKILFKKSPSYLRADFRCCADIRFYNTRSSNFKFIVPQCNSGMKQTFFYNGINDWNDLPEYIKSIHNFVQ